jgi:ubiquinone/menaquinone biosynthesis C-methylase UbiE
MEKRVTQDSGRNERRRQFFDQAAVGWVERNYSPEQIGRVEEMLSILGDVQGATILDVGCGQGVLLPFLRRRAGPAARLIALDSSAPMLRGVGERDAAALPLYASAENIPLIDDYVDRVVCFSAFPHFGDKAAAAREFCRVLKSGGKAYVLHIGSRDIINRHHDKHEAVVGDHLPCAHGMRAMFTEAGFSGTSLDEGGDHYYFSAVK